MEVNRKQANVIKQHAAKESLMMSRLQESVQEKEQRQDDSGRRLAKERSRH